MVSQRWKKEHPQNKSYLFGRPILYQIIFHLISIGYKKALVYIQVVFQKMIALLKHHHCINYLTKIVLYIEHLDQRQ
jgi:hypothetical protein